MVKKYTVYVNKTQIMNKKVHFIAIGGSVMHNLAIALHKKGYIVTGSDDEIFDPAKTRLKKYGLLPEKKGWNISNISTNLDAVILGMHARSDNPELLEAQKLKLKIYSFPEYLYEQSKNKKRIVIAGSHGKTTVTSIIMHVLKFYNIDFDYMVGAKIKGFDVMVKLTDKAKIMIFEGDEYLSSPIDRRPKFHLYKPHIALINGIAWDHINVFPVYENYVKQFKIFSDLICKNGTLIYNNDDPEVIKIADTVRTDIKTIPYSLPEYLIKGYKTFIKTSTTEVPLNVFGKHNLTNINGARKVCNEIGIDDKKFYKAIESFNGATRRLELIASDNSTFIFKDFAHSPSKLKATTEAVKEQFKNKKIVACIELHTYSSLNKNFLSQYNGCLDDLFMPIIFYNPKSVELKKLPFITEEQIKYGFSNPDIQIFTDSDMLKEKLLSIDWHNKVLLMMSSGNFNGLNLNDLAKTLIQKKASETND